MSKTEQRRSWGFKKSFISCTIAPTFFILLYLLFFAQSSYQAEVKLIVRENKESAVSFTSGLAASLLGGGSRISIEDAYILKEFLHGSQFLDLAEQRLGLKTHFSAPLFDPLHSLKKNPTAEEFYEYIRKRIIIQIAPDSSIVTIQANAFNPQMAKDIANLLISESEKAINTLNARMVASQTALAQKELEQSQASLRACRLQLLEFQTKHSMVNPEKEVGSHLANVAGLDAKLVEKKAELKAKQHYMREDAFEVRALQQEIAALEAQRRQETGNLVSSNEQSMAVALQNYEDLKLQAEFALKAYSSAFALVETAKLEAGRQEKFLLLIAPPSLPEEPVYPRPLMGTLTAFAILTVFFGIIRLIVATIRDHSI